MCHPFEPFNTGENQDQDPVSVSKQLLNNRLKILPLDLHVIYTYSYCILVNFLGCHMKYEKVSIKTK